MSNQPGPGQPGHICSDPCYGAGCAKPENIIKARHAFEKWCPVKFAVVSVKPSLNKNKPYCTWFVSYQWNGLNFSYKDHAKESFKSIVKNMPVDVQPKSSSIIYDPECYCVQFTVRCDCQSPNFDIISTQPVFGVLSLLSEVKLENLLQ